MGHFQWCRLYSLSSQYFILCDMFFIQFRSAWSAPRVSRTCRRHAGIWSLRWKTKFWHCSIRITMESALTPSNSQSPSLSLCHHGHLTPIPPRNTKGTSAWTKSPKITHIFAMVSEDALHIHYKGIFYPFVPLTFSSCPDLRHLKRGGEICSGAAAEVYGSSCHLQH